MVGETIDQRMLLIFLGGTQQRRGRKTDIFSPSHSSSLAFSSPLSLIRTSVILTMICCYLMWSIIYLAQLHPLISE
jgi:hypothetical protein